MAVNNIVTEKKSSYLLYEELINKRDRYKKDAFQYERGYVREFGELILAVFNKKIECIEKKKVIDFCQKAINRDEPIDQDKLNAYIKEEMAEFTEKLHHMEEDYREAKSGGAISEKDYLEVKRIYHRIVKKIHPDINPEVAENEDLMDLWNRVVVAYNCNDLQALQELEFLVAQALRDTDIEVVEVEIPNIEEKIKALEEEIEHIISMVPYIYKFLLEDEDAISDKKLELSYELKEYEKYCEELDKVLEAFVISGVTMLWPMN